MSSFTPTGAMVRLTPVFAILLVAAIHLVTSGPRSVLAAQQIEFAYQAAPIDNPLKGLVPYWQQAGPFPASMEFSYFPINSIMKAPSEFDWSPVEEKLEDARSRGNQMVVRMYLEYPGKPSGMPDYLKEVGVEVHKYESDDQVNFTPDYHNPKLISAMKDFVAAFGKKYDGDSRVAFIGMGVLGYWGEWHTWPKTELFATRQTQTEIQNAFAKAFKTTKVLMRSPAGKDDPAAAPNAHQPFGYHDDSFAWATLDTGNKDDFWFFETRMKQAGDKALNKWKSAPIGGEIRPELWGCVFDDESCQRNGQAFEKCVQQLHVSWLMDSGMFSSTKPPTQQRIKNATQQVAKMGYEYFIQSATINRTVDETELTLVVVNRGVAPFYYKWPVEVVSLGPDNNVLKAIETQWDLTKLMPGVEVQWKVNFTVKPEAKLAIRVLNPMKGGRPLRFANQTQLENGLMLLQQ